VPNKRELCNNENKLKFEKFKGIKTHSVFHLLTHKCATRSSWICWWTSWLRISIEENFQTGWHLVINLGERPLPYGRSSCTGLARSLSMIMLWRITLAFLTSHIWVVDHLRVGYRRITKLSSSTPNARSTPFLQLSWHLENHALFSTYGPWIFFTIVYNCG
jgi:hypothetical protein